MPAWDAAPGAGASPRHCRGLARGLAGTPPAPGPRPGPHRAAVAARGLWAGLVIPARRWPPGGRGVNQGRARLRCGSSARLLGPKLEWLWRAPEAAGLVWRGGRIWGCRSLARVGWCFPVPDRHSAPLPGAWWHWAFPHPSGDPQRNKGGYFPLKRHGTRSKPAAKENVCGRNLSVWWVCFRKTGFAFDAISYWEREEKRENRYFLLFLNWKENFALFYVCVYPRAAFPAPLLLLSHTVVVAAVACCPSGPCALLYCCLF